MAGHNATGLQEPSASVIAWPLTSVMSCAYHTAMTLGPV
jgi:hypothetical protein